MRKRVWVRGAGTAGLMLFVALSAEGGGAADDRSPRVGPPPAADLRAEVPALTAFHQVIFPLWHQAWREKNTEMMKDLLPQAREGVEAVAKAELPGILRDRRADWDEGVAALRGAMEKYESAAATNDAQGLADAVEALHAGFEDLVRTIRPVMKELEAYHLELYRIYHYYLPSRDLDSLRAGAERLDARSDALVEAAIPLSFEAMADSLHDAFAALAEETASLRAAARDGQWPRIESAIEVVHDRYRRVEAVLDHPPAVRKP